MAEIKTIWFKNKVTEVDFEIEEGNIDLVERLKKNPDFEEIAAPKKPVIKK